MNNKELLNQIIDELFEDVNELNATIRNAEETDKIFFSGYQTACFNIAENLRYLMSKQI